MATCGTDVVLLWKSQFSARQTRAWAVMAAGRPGARQNACTASITGILRQPAAWSILKQPASATHQRMPLKLECLVEVEGSRKVGADDGREERSQEQAGHQRAWQASRCCRCAAGVNGIGVSSQGSECSHVVCTKMPVGSENKARPQGGSSGVTGRGRGFAGRLRSSCGNSARAPMDAAVRTGGGLTNGGQQPEASPKGAALHKLLGATRRSQDQGGIMACRAFQALESFLP